MDNTKIEVTEERLSTQDADAFLRHSKCGAVSLFVGITRQFTGEKETLRLEYDAYRPMARKELHALAEAALEQWPIQRLVLMHRIGVVPIREASVIVGVATPHRDASFAACRYLIDTLKAQVPIWKREIYSDGSREWVEGTRPEPGDDRYAPKEDRERAGRSTSSS
jgi:molybdopterin synthase catalytic subunit